MIADHEDHLDADVIIGAVLTDNHFEPSNVQARVLADEVLDLRIKLERADQAMRRLATANAILTSPTGPSPADPISAASLLSEAS